jgi:hypothetical protein
MTCAGHATFGANIMTKDEMQIEALDRARTSQALTNYPAIFEGFMAKGIAEADIKPRENVFTFHAWKALGRSVKRGAHGVRVDGAAVGALIFLGLTLLLIAVGVVLIYWL